MSDHCSNHHKVSSPLYPYWSSIRVYLQSTYYRNLFICLFVYLLIIIVVFVVVTISMIQSRQEEKMLGKVFIILAVETEKSIIIIVIVVFVVVVVRTIKLVCAKHNSEKMHIENFYSFISWCQALSLLLA